MDKVDVAYTDVKTEVRVEVTVVVFVVVEEVGREAVLEVEEEEGLMRMVLGGRVVVLMSRELPAPAPAPIDGVCVAEEEETETGISFFLNQEEVGRTTAPNCASLNVTSPGPRPEAEAEAAVGRTTSPNGSMNVASTTESVGLTLLDATLDATGVLARASIDVAGTDLAGAALELPPLVGMVMVTPAALQRPSATVMNVASSAALQAAATCGATVAMKLEAWQMQAKSVMLHFVAPIPFSRGVVWRLIVRILGFCIGGGVLVMGDLRSSREGHRD